MTTRGTNTFMILLYKKFCTPCTPFAPSAASRFWLMDSILLLSARSNLSACTTSKVHDRVSFPGPTILPTSIEVFTVHFNVLIPNSSVKIGWILIFIPTLVPGLTTKFVIGFEVYTLRFCCVRVQIRNPGLLMDWLIVSVHLFLKMILSCGLDHWAINPPLIFSCQGRPGDSSIARSIPGTSSPIFWHCELGYW